MHNQVNMSQCKNSSIFFFSPVAVITPLPSHTSILNKTHLCMLNITDIDHTFLQTGLYSKQYNKWQELLYRWMWVMIATSKKVILAISKFSWTIFLSSSLQSKPLILYSLTLSFFFYFVLKKICSQREAAQKLGIFGSLETHQKVEVTFLW